MIMKKEEMSLTNKEKCCQLQTNLNLSEFESFKFEEKTVGGLKLDISFPNIKIRVNPSHIFRIKGEKK